MDNIICKCAIKKRKKRKKKNLQMGSSHLQVLVALPERKVQCINMMKFSKTIEYAIKIIR